VADGAVATIRDPNALGEVTRVDARRVDCSDYSLSERTRDEQSTPADWEVVLSGGHGDILVAANGDPQSPYDIERVPSAPPAVPTLLCPSR
jgi:hypothetical protein